MLRPQRCLGQVLEKLWQTREKTQTRTEFGEHRVGHAIHSKVVEQAFHVGQLAVPLLPMDEAIALFPELRRIDPELGEQHVVLHVSRTQSLIVIIH